MKYETFSCTLIFEFLLHYWFNSVCDIFVLHLLSRVSKPVVPLLHINEVPPVLTTAIIYPSFPSLGKITMGVSCLTDTQNINQADILKPQYRPHFIHVEMPDVKGDHFSSKNTQC